MQPAKKETMKVMFCNQMCDVLKKEISKVTRETKALVDAVPSGLGEDEWFMAYACLGINPCRNACGSAPRTAVNLASVSASVQVPADT